MNSRISFMVLQGKSKEFLSLELLGEDNRHVLEQTIDNSLSILWLKKPAILKIDGTEHYFTQHQIVCFTEFHKIEVIGLKEAQWLRFNHPFCCIKDLDEETGCKGLLFYNASQVPIACLHEEELEQLDSLFKVLEQEMGTRDKFQPAVLQIILKRIIIFCAGVFRQQKPASSFQSSHLDVIREFNYLVEIHFKTIHTVAGYAALLNKSPKTLSNLFARYNEKTPLQIIQERVLLEARRLLLYTSKSVKEIAFETGFEDIQTFSRFFKTREGVGPKEYRAQVPIREKLTTL